MHTYVRLYIYIYRYTCIYEHTDTCSSFQTFRHVHAASVSIQAHSQTCHRCLLFFFSFSLSVLSLSLRLCYIRFLVLLLTLPLSSLSLPVYSLLFPLSLALLLSLTLARGSASNSLGAKSGRARPSWCASSLVARERLPLSWMRRSDLGSARKVESQAAIELISLRADVEVDRGFNLARFNLLGASSEQPNTFE